MRSDHQPLIGGAPGNHLRCQELQASRRHPVETRIRWRCRFRKQGMLLLSGFNREKGKQSGFGHEG